MRFYPEKYPLHGAQAFWAGYRWETLEAVARALAPSGGMGLQLFLLQSRTVLPSRR